MTDINKNLQICIQKLALTEGESNLMREIFLRSGKGEIIGISDLYEIERRILENGDSGSEENTAGQPETGQPAFEQPEWIMEKDGEIHLMSVVEDFLDERFPKLPEGCTLKFPEEKEKFAIDDILDEGCRIINGFSEKRTEGILLMTGPEGSGKHFYFTQLAARVNLNLLSMNLETFITANGRDEESLSRALTAFYIAALLYDTLPVIETDGRTVGDSDYCISRGLTGFRKPETVIRIISGLFGNFCMSFETVNTAGKRIGTEADGKIIHKDFGAPAVTLEMPKLSAKVRRDIIDRIADNYLSPVNLTSHSRDLIAGKKGISSLPLGCFVRYVRSMVTRAEIEGNTDFAFEPDYMGDGNESLKLMRCIRTIDELKLPLLQKKQLQKICAMCGARDNVLSAGGFFEKFSYGNGLSVLFYGAPGTGKTMAAEVIASSLGKPLYRVELSQLINKYIGETQKNIGRIFDEAEKNDCVLLFDEADAIFAKRGEVADAQDRYSNAETAYLLQRMESYTGICVLTTNLFQNFDEAFRRRITYMINFPMPDESIRLELWKEIFPKKTSVSENVDFELLAKHFELSGASIRNIAQHAALFAAAEGCAEVGIEHIIDGILNEYSKTGKNLSDSQKEIIASYI